MEGAREISRKEFLEGVPGFVIRNMRAVFQGRSICLGEDETEKAGRVSNEIKDKVARLEEECCLAWGGASCQSCYLACPLRDEAIILDDQRPVIKMSFCDGCGRCVTVCQTVNDMPALRIVERRRLSEMPAGPQSSQGKLAQAEPTLPSAT